MDREAYQKLQVSAMDEWFKGYKITPLTGRPILGPAIAHTLTECKKLHDLSIKTPGLSPSRDRVVSPRRKFEWRKGRGDC
jgi:hypothetical protein